MSREIPEHQQPRRDVLVLIDYMGLNSFEGGADAHLHLACNQHSVPVKFTARQPGSIEVSFEKRKKKCYAKLSQQPHF